MRWPCGNGFPNSEGINPTFIVQHPSPFVDVTTPSFSKAVFYDDARPDRRVGSGLNLRGEDGGDRRYRILENLTTNEQLLDFIKLAYDAIKRVTHSSTYFTFRALRMQLMAVTADLLLRSSGSSQ